MANTLEKLQSIYARAEKASSFKYFLLALFDYVEELLTMSMTRTTKSFGQKSQKQTLERRCFKTRKMTTILHSRTGE
ncbi:hypothetical protein COX05_01540 [candidate division WWE3 bacterium CG22_combo_CG10-13_8_21_14_all_39_12]|uniref:Uncharacterized protein n=2 Tax=Katanobacteria TaxID=422282 RepID=A0A2M7X2F4_UNCKA|nr:MAG: hypothetical protein COX05_01540 [candidate division WWE3 bacterium CG22_combo_CG10-13_8_21_14_all_39_12]PJA40289.1 MAG: hypothetical protein CO179_02760 [candidate division WWE3 bacterium CG_4_9_14_3_um_filter_39_7]